MANLSIEDILRYQRALQDRYAADWGGVAPKKARDQLLWAYGEMAEMGDIIKKQGDDAIMDDPETRRHFVEELGDVIMYLGDVMHCYGITAEEFSQQYVEKVERNLSRW